jgi:TonB family protein
VKHLWPVIFVLVAACVSKPTPPPPPVEKPVAAVDENWLQENAKDHNHDVLVCYQNRLKAKPKLQGDLRLDFLATHDGEMKEVKVVKSVDAEVDRCVLAAAKNWKFPWAARGGTFDLLMTDTFKLTFDGAQPRSEYKEEEQGMDREQIRLVVKDHVKDIRGCYEDRLRSAPGLVGKIILEWNIEANGFAHDVKIKQSLDPVLDQCLITKLKTWVFPLPMKGHATFVNYPFTFTSE